MYLQQILGAEVGIVDHRHQRLDDLGQVVRRDVGRHADGDAGAAVDQQLRNGRGQDDRLAQRGVVVVAEVDGLVADVAQQLFGDRRQARFGVAHGGGAVAVERAEVALAVHQRVAQRERLRHAHHGLVRGDVAVRMILAEHLADDGRRLARPRAGGQAQVLVHGVQDAPLHRLEPVAHVGQRARGDDAQRVRQVALLSRLAEINCGDTFRVFRLHVTVPFAYG